MDNYYDGQNGWNTEDTDGGYGKDRELANIPQNQIYPDDGASPDLNGYKRNYLEQPGYRQGFRNLPDYETHPGQHYPVSYAGGPQGNGQGNYPQYDSGSFDRQGFAQQYAGQPNQYAYGGKPGNGFAIAALILGISSIILFWTMPVAMIIAIVGIVMSIVAMYKNQSRGMSIAGMITSIIGAMLAVLAIILVIVTLSRLDSIDTYDSDDDFFPYPYAEEEEENPLEKFEEFFDEFS